MTSTTMNGATAANVEHDPAGIETSAKLVEALTVDKREGLQLAVRARFVALAIIAPLLVYQNPTWLVLYYEAILVGFALIGWAQLQVGRVGRSRPELLLILCDLTLLTFTIVVPNPMIDFEWPIAMQCRFENFIYFFILLAPATLAYSWRTLIAMGAWTALLWIGAMIWVLLRPVRAPELSDAVQAALADHPELFALLDPNQVNIGNRIQELVVFMIVAATLALASRRANRLLVQQAAASRERANLARYFPPGIVDQLAEQDEPLGAVRVQSVAILFADIVGFTRVAEQQTPGEVVGFLRDFHARLEHNVFEYGGTLDKFLGDGVMATFGTPVAGEHDATNAVRCARAMATTIEAWNSERRAAGASEVRLSIGAHYGEVVLGDIGSERRLEFAVLGDPVNVASRLEALTRELGVQIILSDALVHAARAESDSEVIPLFEGFADGHTHELRGRSEPIALWTRPFAAPNP